MPSLTRNFQLFYLVIPNKNPTFAPASCFKLRLEQLEYRILRSIYAWLYQAGRTSVRMSRLCFYSGIAYDNKQQLDYVAERLIESKLINAVLYETGDCLITEITGKGILEVEIKMKDNNFLSRINKRIIEGTAILQSVNRLEPKQNNEEQQSPNFVYYYKEETDDITIEITKWQDKCITLVNSEDTLDSDCVTEFKNKCRSNRPSRDWKKSTAKKIEELILKLETFKEIYEETSKSLMSQNVVSSPNPHQNTNSKKVFIVHGHDDSAINEVKLFLINVGLEPIVLRDQPDKGQTIIEKLEKNTDVCFAIVLYTPCDLGRAANENGEFEHRARQNVVFEHGFLFSKLTRARVCIMLPKI